MNRILLLALGASIPSVLLAEGERRPNVVLIYADDVGVGDLSCYGATEISTPHIDRIAREGIRFTNAYSAAATSTPSRYAMLTGEYPFRRKNTGVAAGNASMIIRSERYTIADLFQKAGYATAVIGKWHLGLGDKTGEQDWNAPLSADPRDLGFDYSYIMAATGDRVPCVFIEQGRVANHDPQAPIEVSYEEPFEGEPLGKTHPDMLTKLKPSHGHDMAIVNDISRIGYMRGGGKALWQDEHIADSLVHRAKRFIQSKYKEPFFLYLAPNDIHVPRYPHSRFRGKSKLGLRGDAILQLDWLVGEVLRQLDKLGIADNTLLIFSSDNGAIVDDGYADKAVELLGKHRPSSALRGHKYGAFEGGARVPTLLRYKAGGIKGQVSDVLVMQVDWLRSFASLLGDVVPRDAAPDSQDMLASWLGQSQASREYVVTQAVAGVLSLRQGKWKYIEPSLAPSHLPWLPDVESGSAPEAQLYDLSRDSQERYNLAKEYPELVKEFSEIIRLEKAKGFNL